MNVYERLLQISKYFMGPYFERNSTEVGSRILLFLHWHFLQFYLYYTIISVFACSFLVIWRFKQSWIKFMELYTYTQNIVL